MPTSVTTSTRCRKWSPRLQTQEYGLAVGSRYVAGGGIANWPTRRIITSKVACWLARPLTSVHDVTSGYFLVRREALEGVELDPIGFKIGLEVIAKAHYGRAIEIPYVFTDRVAGQSKLNEREIFNYIKQLTRLYGRGCRRARRSTKPNADARLVVEPARQGREAGGRRGAVEQMPEVR